MNPTPEHNRYAAFAKTLAQLNRLTLPAEVDERDPQPQTLPTSDQIAEAGDLVGKLQNRWAQYMLAQD